MLDYIKKRWAEDLESWAGSIRVIDHLDSESGQKLNGQQAKVIGGDHFDVGWRRRIFVELMDGSGRQLKVLPWKLHESPETFQQTRALQEQSFEPLPFELGSEAIQIAIKWAAKQDFRPDQENRLKWLQEELLPAVIKNQSPLPTWPCQSPVKSPDRDLEGLLNRDDWIAMIYSSHILCYGNRFVVFEEFGRLVEDAVDLPPGDLLHLRHRVSVRLQEFLTSGFCALCNYNVFETEEAKNTLLG